MLFQKYLNSISTLNPEKIYVENVRSILGIHVKLARLLCEMAVTDKVFESKIGIECPNSDCKRIIKSFDSVADIPEQITCDVCEHTDHENHTFRTDSLQKIKYYKLKV